MRKHRTEVPVKTEAEIGVTQSKAKEDMEPPVTKRQGRILP